MPGVNLPKEDEGKIMHIGLPVGDKGDVLMASDSLESLGQKIVQGNNSTSRSTPTAKTRPTGSSRASSSGGSIEMPIADQPWGDYWGSFKDKFGVLWMVDYSHPK